MFSFPSFQMKPHRRTVSHRPAQDPFVEVCAS
jgi:hypothetical protein